MPLRLYNQDGSYNTDGSNAALLVRDAVNGLIQHLNEGCHQPLHEQGIHYTTGETGPAAIRDLISIVHGEVEMIGARAILEARKRDRARETAVTDTPITGREVRKPDRRKTPRRVGDKSKR